MPRPLIHALLLVSAIAGACGGDDATDPPPAAPSSTASDSARDPAGQRGDRVTIKDFAFAPETLEAQPGATVTVENADEVAHTLTGVDEAFDTGNLAAGASATVTLPDAPGAYEYLCSIHDYMRGSLRVVE